ncbi:MAG: helix-turn-helix domain-containing protein [Oscillospiraceae bacterium]|nr:helix-turn-helix domain-containing protein [Lachnospiraceae bacterium]MBO7727494.1 helix-turn-helix domain-containing protein [Oscillospiraceae bacterium]
MTEFQERLLKAIAERNITAAELSRITGIDKGSLSNYINGLYAPKQDKCFLLARALCVDPGWLMTGDEPSQKQLAEENMLVDAYRHADEGTKSAVRKLLDIK